MGNILGNINNLSSFDFKTDPNTVEIKKPVKGTDANFTGKITYNTMEGTTVRGANGNFGNVNVDSGGDIKIGTSSLNSRITALETASTAVSSGTFNTGTFSGMLTANGGLRVGSQSNPQSILSTGQFAHNGSATIGNLLDKTKTVGIMSNMITYGSNDMIGGPLTVGQKDLPQQTTLNGNLTVNGTGTFSGALNATGGLTTTNLTGTSGTFTGVIGAGNRVNITNTTAPTVSITNGVATIPVSNASGLVINDWNIGEVKGPNTSSTNRLCFSKAGTVFACLDASGNLAPPTDTTW